MNRWHGPLWGLLMVASLFAVSCTAASEKAAPDLKAPVAKGPAVKGGWEGEWESTLAAARKEGNLVVYSTTAGDVLRQIFPAFQQKYGIQVDFIVGRGVELVRKMQAERTASLYLPDVVMSGGTTILVNMKPLGLVESMSGAFILPEVSDKAAWVRGDIPFLDQKQYAIGMLAVLQRYMLRNTSQVKENELKSYADLLDPKWKSKLVLNDPTTSGAGNAFFNHLSYDIWGQERTLDFMRQLVRQEVAITRDTEQQVEWVARGKHAVAIAPMQERVAYFIEAGAPLALIKAQEGGKIGPGIGGLALASKRPHPSAARLFVNWLLSKEGHALVVRYYKYPGTRVDAPKTGIPAIFFPDPGEKVYFDTEEEILGREKSMQRSTEIFRPLMR